MAASSADKDSDYLMNTPDDVIYDTIIVGAGPAGLTTANILGAAGLDVLILEAADDIPNYPRAVGIDEESLRTFQAIGLSEPLLPHYEPGYRVVLRDNKGRAMVEMRPSNMQYGWVGGGFVQPLADRVMFEGLARYRNVAVQFNARYLGSAAATDHQVVRVLHSNGKEQELRARWVVGADGGSSTVRKSAGIEFPGATSPFSWLVVDVEGDPSATLGASAICEPGEPIVSIQLPHGIRRYEFRVNNDEPHEVATSAASLQRRLSLVMPAPERATIIRSRVYQHHSRVASAFRSGRIMLVGDAAHLMPVWQGQGYNNGLRDAFNLAWKIAAVAKGFADESLLDTYEAERRPHVTSMVAVSTNLGKIITLDNRILAKGRDLLFAGIRKIPKARNYILEGSFKPVPAFGTGAIVTSAADRVKIPVVGKLMPQPFVLTGGRRVRLDDVLGSGFSILTWGKDPLQYMDAASEEFWRKLGASIVTVVQAQQLDHNQNSYPERCFVGDEGVLHDWFSTTEAGIVVIRPDRIVAMACDPQEASAATQAFAKAISWTGQAH